MHALNQDHVQGVLGTSRLILARRQDAELIYDAIATASAESDARIARFDLANLATRAIHQVRSGVAGNGLLHGVLLATRAGADRLLDALREWRNRDGRRRPGFAAEAHTWPVAPAAPAGLAARFAQHAGRAGPEDLAFGARVVERGWAELDWRG